MRLNIIQDFGFLFYNQSLFTHNILHYLSNSFYNTIPSFTQLAKQIDFWTLLKLTQEYVSQHYAAVLTDKTKLGQLKAYVDKYLRDNDYHVENLTTKELIDKLYCEMAEYSVLTPFLGSPDLEEINVNGWDDIALTYLDGSIVKMKDHFHSPQHAVDII